MEPAEDWKNEVCDMIRWLPALAAAAGCVAAAIRWTQRMTARRDALSTWTRVLTRMEANLALYDDMPSLLRAAATGEMDGEVRTVLLTCAEEMEKKPARTLEAAMCGLKTPSLQAEDRAALEPVWRTLGRSGGEESRSVLQIARRSISQCAEAAEVKLKTNRRLAGSLGTLGALAALLFFG